MPRRPVPSRSVQNGASMLFGRAGSGPVGQVAAVVVLDGAAADDEVAVGVDADAGRTSRRCRRTPGTLKLRISSSPIGDRRDAEVGQREVARPSAARGDRRDARLRRRRASTSCSSTRSAVDASAPSAPAIAQVACRRVVVQVDRRVRRTSCSCAVTVQSCWSPCGDRSVGAHVLASASRRPAAARTPPAGAASAGRCVLRRRGGSRRSAARRSACVDSMVIVERRRTRPAPRLNCRGDDRDRRCRRAPSVLDVVAAAGWPRHVRRGPGRRRAGPACTGALIDGMLRCDGVDRVGRRARPCRSAVSSNVRPGLPAVVEVDAAGADVERIGRRDQVLLDDVGGRRRHQRRLDLARASSPGAAALSRMRRRRRCAATTSTCRRSPGSTRRAGRSATLSGVGVWPARICTPGAVMSGLMNVAAGTARGERGHHVALAVGA